MRYYIKSEEDGTALQAFSNRRMESWACARVARSAQAITWRAFSPFNWLAKSENRDSIPRKESVTKTKKSHAGKR